MEDIEPILHDKEIIKLFFPDRRKYPLHCKNWGESKGEDLYSRKLGDSKTPLES